MDKLNLFLNFFSKDIHTSYIDNITGDYNNTTYCMFKAECYLNNIKYNCERVKKNGKTGLCFSRSDWEEYTQEAFDIEGEDPRIVILNEEVYVIFICLSPYLGQNRCIAITKFNKWKPIYLQLENVRKNHVEKNWAPFVKDNKLYFVYNYEPLIIISYDLNDDGICKIIFKQNNVNLPINTGGTFLRGGSNLLQYKDDYYIGSIHTRLYYKKHLYYTLIVLLDTKKWEIVYLSKPVLYNYNLMDNLKARPINGKEIFKKLDTFHNILVDCTQVRDDNQEYILQSPISLYLNNNKYYITINVRDSVTLLYEIEFINIINFIEENKEIHYWHNKLKKYMSYLLY